MDVKLPEKCCDNPQRFVVAPVVGFECRNCGYRECRVKEDELLKELVFAIEEHFKAMDADEYDFLKTPLYRIAVEKVLQKYHKHVGE